MLLEEDPAESLDLLGPCVLEIHLANPALDPAHPAYGDTHLPPGPPGALDISDYARLLSRGIETGLLARRRPIVTAEIRSAADADPWDTAARSQRIVNQAWQAALCGLGEAH